MLALLLLGQAASPDIQLHAEVTARRVRIEQRGSATLTVRADPDGGSTVKVAAPRTGANELTNVKATVDAEARLAPPPPDPNR